MSIGLTDLTIRTQQHKLHPADELFAYMVIQIHIMHKNFEKASFIEIKQKLHSLYSNGYEDGYQQGVEDERGESRRPLGK